MRFADIACGSGSFLLGVYDTLLRYHAAYYNRTKKNRDIGIKAGCISKPDGTLQLSLLQKRQILINNIYGVDIDPQAVEVAQLSLYLKLLEDEDIQSAKSQQRALHAALLPSLSKNIACGNSLIERGSSEGKLFETADERGLNPMNFEDAFSEVMKRGGFDAIVGNPPYIRIQTLQETSPKSVEYFGEHYAAASKGNYDIYVVFVERAIGLLNTHGKLGYILPHKFFNAKYGEPLRRILSQGRHLSHIVHFGAAQVFKGATTYTCLLFADKATHGQMRFVRATSLKEWRAKKAGDEGMIPVENITSDEWNFVVGHGANLFNRLSAMSRKLGSVADIFVGLQTSADDVFIMNLVSETDASLLLHSKALDRELRFEKRFFFPLISGTDVSRYAALPQRQFILFPYEVKADEVRLVDFDALLSGYPQTAEYFLENKKILEARENGRMKGPQWYGYIYLKNMRRQGLQKICVPRLVESLYAAYDVDGKHFLDNVDVGGITLKPEFQNQTLRYLLALLNSHVLRWYFPFVSAPFRGGWLSANRQFLSQLPFRPIDFSKSYEALTHDRIVQLVDQMLGARKQLASAQTERDKTFYENKCATLDRQIDQLVYELYELTPEEIAIVETATSK